MKSARRQAFIARKNKDKVRNQISFRFLIPVLIIVGIFLFFKFSIHFWNGKDKVSLVYREDNGDVTVTVLDPKLSEVINLIIPGDTQVDVARNYGTFRIKNVWQFGINEKIGGCLLAETVTQNFLFPVSLWSSKSPGFNNGNVGQMIGFVFFPGQTNISFGDRIAMGLFVLKIQDLSKSTIDLGKSQFLDKKSLNDGQPGYAITGPISQRLKIYFSDNEIGEKGVRVNITDATGVSGVTDKLGEILQVIGGKIVSIDKKSVAEDIDCAVSGLNRDVVKKIANLFSCKVGGTDTSFDLDIKIGTEFAKRF